MEPLLRLEQDSRVRMALGQFAEAADAGGERAPAAAMLERNRISGMLREHLAGARGTTGAEGDGRG